MLRASGRFIICAMFVWSRQLGAQADYYNLDAGRPTRIEDAVPAPRYSLELLLGGIRFERLAGGIQRWRTEPKLVYGVLPFTEIELRVPIVHAVAQSSDLTSTGIAGVGLGVLHAFNVETSRLPAFALSSELLLPGGAPLGAPTASYSIKALATRTTRVARFHINGAAGTYSVRPLPSDTVPCVLATPSGICLNGNVTAVPFDFPCERAATSATTKASVILPRAVAAPADPLRSSGNRWLVGIGADHSWGLQSLLLSGDVYAEHFDGLYPLTDWTAEIGARRQLTPRLVFDIGALRRFAGTVQSSGGTFGLSYALSTLP